MRRKSIRTSWSIAIGLSLGLAIARGIDAEEPKAAPPPSEPAKEAKPAPKPHVKHPPNLLAKETSPYLLLHAHNPVQWRPWNKETLELAKKEKKPIFLSIGYSSCYWCHVMERESFMDEEIAKFLNKNFVCIKVDREERPDVDEIYMTSLITYYELAGAERGGGWPLSMFLTSDAKPFFGGTYFPPRDREKPSMTGFLTVLQRVLELWAKDQERVGKMSEALTETVKLRLQPLPGAALIKLRSEMVDRAFEEISSAYDEAEGGFRLGSTKFPNPAMSALMLLRAEQGDAKAKKIFLHTLDSMAERGLYDHLGGGFHRYTVDAGWRVPHFEKMLYDNGQLLPLYAAAYRITKQDRYRRVVVETCDFLLREMTDAKGGFYAAIDAESEAVEGKFYVWKRDEIAKTLTKEEYALFAAVYGVLGEPNFEHDQYVLQVAAPWGKLAADRGDKEDALAAQLMPIRNKLLAARAIRKRPLTDTKVLTGWNGLAIRGLADAGRELGEPRYIAAAAKAADFILANSRRDGRLLRTWTAGEAKIDAYVEDYALFVDGLLALHATTKEARWLTVAEELTRKQIELFGDAKNGGFYFTAHDGEQLIIRRKDAYDGPIASGNSVSAANLLTLAQLTGKKEFGEQAAKTLQSLAPRLERGPESVPRAVVALDRYLRGMKKP